MSIQFNPQSVPPAVNESAGQSAAPRAVPAMAPVHLTPLVPPSSARVPLPAAPAQPGGLLEEGRRAQFAQRQKALLDRLREGGPAPAAASALSDAQRSACASVLATVVAAAAG
ncbi:MAG: hypothetical protein NBV65_02930 [Burkholderiaceae bacterium]|nr:hypothetical protein [Burkholderiaceae bacterium]